MKKLILTIKLIIEWLTPLNIAKLIKDIKFIWK